MELEEEIGELLKKKNCPFPPQKVARAGELRL